MTPLKSGIIFSVALHAPILLLALFAPKATSQAFPNHAWAVGLLVFSLLFSGAMFGLGAHCSGRPHRLTSLAMSVLLTWVMSRAFTSIIEGIDMGGELMEGLLIGALGSVFIFLAGWRLAPHIKLASQE